MSPTILHTEGCSGGQVSQSFLHTKGVRGGKVSRSFLHLKGGREGQVSQRRPLSQRRPRNLRAAGSSPTHGNCLQTTICNITVYIFLNVYFIIQDPGQTGGQEAGGQESGHNQLVYTGGQTSPHSHLYDR